jgi:O-antigen ligase
MEIQESRTWIRNNMESREITTDRSWKAFFTSSFSPLTVIGITLLFGVGLGIIIPSFMSHVYVLAQVNKVGGILGPFGLAFWGVVVAILIVLIILFRQDELAATIVMAISLCLDWYLATYIVAQILALALLLIFFFGQSHRYPWGEPRVLWLWILFLALTIFPAIRGATDTINTLYYYPNLILGALTMFWLGTVIARNATALRRFFKLVSAFATLIALHIIIEAVTGKLLFVQTNVQNFLDGVSNYQLGNTGISRLGSFFVQPDAGSAFLAVMLFIPLGLFVESSSLFQKALYITEVILISLALLFTYSTGAWLAACAGIVVFIILVGSTRFSIQMSLCVIIAVAILVVGFHSQLQLLFQHAHDPNELSIRLGAWETALKVIRAFPLTGIGLSRTVYLQIADPFRVPAQTIALNNPHNSYLELAAMGGIPVILVFPSLLVYALWKAFGNWIQVDRRARPLLGAGIAAIITFSFNSLSFGVWTFPPLAVPGWLIPGVISSPLLIKSHEKKP